MKPTKDLVLVLADKPKEKSTSGILIAEEWKSLPPTGTVLAVGPLVQEVKVGDRILFERYGSVILPDDKRVCKESHILAVLEGEDAPA